MGFRVNKVRLVLLAALAIYVAIKWLHPAPPRQTRALPRGTVQIATGDIRTEPAAPSSAALPGRDLSQDEARGGHTLARHVGRTDAQLHERLATEEISAASTWPDRATAERTVARALARDAEKIAAWERRDGQRPNLALHYHGDEIIGRSLRPGAKETTACRDAVIVLKWTEAGWFVLTAYPEAK